MNEVSGCGAKLGRKPIVVGVALKNNFVYIAESQDYSIILLTEE